MKMSFKRMHQKKVWKLFFEMNFILDIKGTLMQIWKSYNMFGFLQKQYPENFTFLILRIIELFDR